MNLKISQLVTYTNGEANSSDSIAIVDMVNGITKQISLTELDKRWKGLPAGGTAGQAMVKNTSVDGDASWVSLTKSMVGLGNVNNTADVDKPISNATQAALNLKANLTQLSSKADKTYVDDQLLLKQNNLPSGNDGDILTLVDGSPVWQASAMSTVTNYGDPLTNGSWRIRLDSGSLVVEVRKLGTWVPKHRFNP